MKFNRESSATISTIEFAELDWLIDPFNGGLRAGASYLVSGAPGANKSTLVIQIACDLARQGISTLLVLTEQAPHEVEDIVARICGCTRDAVPSVIWEHLEYEMLDDPEELADLARLVIPQRYPRAQIVLVDSLQGRGLPSVATRTYRRIFEAIDACKARGLTTLLVSHVTKAGNVAGPKALEHKVDVVVMLRHAFALRQMFIAKNRFGPQVADPLMLQVTGGRLAPSPHGTECSAAALGYAGEDELVEIQASVSLPRLNSRPELNAPFLPYKRVRQILSTLSRLPGIDLNDVTYTINALVPTGLGYTPPIDLPIALSVLAAYVQAPIPRRAVFVGQVDLRRNVRSPSQSFLAALADLLASAANGRVTSVFVSNSCAGMLRELLGAGEPGAAIRVVGVSSIDSVLSVVWPHLFSRTAEAHAVL
jgi:DNA repair protein RadA/Sms